MKQHHSTNLSEVAAIQPLEVARLIAFSDAVARCRNTAAMIGSHDSILNDGSNEAAGLCQALSQLESDLDVIASDLASMAIEVRSHGCAMASRVSS